MRTHRSFPVVLVPFLLLISSQDVPALEDEGYQDADEAWNGLLSSGEVPGRVPGESHFERFAREVELSRQRRRELGLEFWRQYPNDPRRYDWLIHAVYLAPHYPEDIREWAAAELLMRPNLAAVDSSAADEWNAIYPALRSEFWNSEAVSDEQRRELWFGELFHRANGMATRSALGQEFDVDAWAAELLSFLTVFPEPANIEDAQRDSWRVRALLDIVCRYGDLLGVAEDWRTDLYEELSRVSGHAKESVSAAVGDCAFYSKGVDEDPSMFVEWYDSQFGMGLHSGARLKRPSGLIYFHEVEYYTRRSRARGALLWKRGSASPMAVTWLNNAAPNRTFYYTRFIDGLVENVDRFKTSGRLYYGGSRDVAAQAAWEKKRDEILAGLSENPDISEEERIRIEGTHLGSFFNDVLLEAHHQRTDRVSELVSRLRDFHARYDDRGFGYTYKLARDIAGNAALLRIDSSEVDGFLRSFGAKSLERLADGLLTRDAARITPVELSGPTIEGGFLDIADLRSKIVLLKFWSTSCAGCIAAMPEVQAIYDEYRDRGFEVVAINSDYDRRGKRVERIIDSAGTTWPTIVGDEHYNRISTRLGFGKVVPQYMLLDRGGTMAADTAEIEDGDLRALLDGLLAARAEIDESP